jgi:protein-tyrosine phosphatase
MHQAKKGALARTTLVALVIALASASALAQSADHVRRLPLQGAPNVRDIGGYATSNGKHVKWRQVYRAGALARLTDRDYEYLAGLGIAVVCDFRRDDERRAAPTEWRGPNPPEILALPGVPGPPVTGARDLLASGAGAEAVAASLRASYERYPESFASSYGTTLQRIINGSGPTLYHCSAGKDRTGLFSALLLTFLGVPRETVFEDYLLTNTYIGTADRIAATAKDLKASPEAARPLLIADRSYLEAAFHTIDRTYGSLDNYRRTALKLSDQDLERLKARLLED